MHGRVYLKIDPSQKSLAAHLTEIWFLASVYTQMRIEVTLADEHLVAHHAWILAIVHARVYLLVALTKAFGDKTAATYLAHVRLHAQVTVLMVQQRLLRLEVLATRVTRIRL